MSDFLSQFENPQPPVGRTPPARPPASAGPPAPVAAPGTSKAPAHVRPGSGSRATGSRAIETAISPAPTGGIEVIEHRVEVDAGYRRHRTIRWIIIAAAVVLVAGAAALIWHFARLVEIPDFTGQPLATAQSFCRNNNLTLVVVDEFSTKVDSGTVMAQDSAAAESLSQGDTLTLTVSQGPNPDDRLALPDFAELKRTEAERWLNDNRADNLRLVFEFSPTVAKDDFLRLEFRSSDVTAENYRRRDYATVYYSKGAEVFEKNITVPDFTTKTRAEVEAWAQTNALTLTVNEEASDTVGAGLVINQNVKAGEKVAKHDAFAITISLGKAIVVPNFSRYSAATAAGAAGQIPISVETRYSDTVPYGKFVSQSIGAGTRLLPDEVRPITVVYSEGRPFLKDYRGVSEGELPATFFNDFTAKGARITYEVYYVDSYETKGSVVDVSDYNRFVPLSFHVVMAVSRGNLTPPTVDPPVTKP